MKITTNATSFFLIKIFSSITPINPLLITNKHYCYVNFLLILIKNSFTNFTNFNNFNNFYSIIWKQKIQTHFLIKSKSFNFKNIFKINFCSFSFKKNIMINETIIILNKNNKNLILKSLCFKNFIESKQYLKHLHHLNILNLNINHYFAYLNKIKFQNLFVLINTIKFFSSKIVTISNKNILNTNNFLI